VDENTEIHLAARRAISEAVEAGAFSVLGMALENPDVHIFTFAISALRNIPLNAQRELVIPALMSPLWPDPGEVEWAIGASRDVWYSAQESMLVVISKIEGAELRSDRIWNSEERSAFAKRLHERFGLPLPRGTFTARAATSRTARSRASTSTANASSGGSESTGLDIPPARLAVATTSRDNALRVLQLGIGMAVPGLLAVGWYLHRLRRK